MIYFTSDTHFCHDREFCYKPRGFNSVDEMNEAIIERWNKVVGPEDTVYHLGDVMLNDNEKGLECLSRLNGKIIMIRGNHDTDARENLYYSLPNVIRSGDYSSVIKVGKLHFYLSHFPTFTSNLEKDENLTLHLINLYGHTHQHTNFYQDIPFMYHVGVDSHNCTPVSLDQIIEDIHSKIEENKTKL